MGFHIASLLAEQNQEVVVVDQSPEALENIRRSLDVKTLEGNAATPGVLREAEAHRANLVIAVTGSDETNLITCFIAKEMGAAITTARVRNPEYSGYFIAPARSPGAVRKVIRPRHLGVDLFINPEVEAVREIMNILAGFYPTPVENFMGGRVQVREFRVVKEALVNKPLRELSLPKPCVLAAIARAGEMTLPGADEVLKVGDHVYLLAESSSMDELGRIFDQPQRPARSVVILGGGNVGFFLAQGLEGRGVSVKIIEESIERCRLIASKLVHTVVVQCEATDRDLFIEEGVPKADAFVAATDKDELNILHALLAKNLGVPWSLALVNKPAYIPLAKEVGVDVAASPLLLTASKVVRFALHGGAVNSALLGGKEVQVIEFVTSPTAHVVGHRVEEVGWPKGVVAAALGHNDTVTVRPQDTVVQPGDHLVVISPLSAVPLVERLFK